MVMTVIKPPMVKMSGKIFVTRSPTKPSALNFCVGDSGKGIEPPGGGKGGGGTAARTEVWQMINEVVMIINIFIHLCMFLNERNINNFDADKFKDKYGEYQE